VPIALLPELTTTLDRTGRVLTPWSRLVLLEEQILRRARGAFLVHWFGTSVPVRTLSLYIAIVNIADLKQRYLEVKRSMPGPPTELNLLGPLSGMAGFLVGIAVSPTGAILIASQMHRIMDSLVGGTGGGILAMLYRVFGVWILPALGPALGLLALPVLLVGALGLAVGGEGVARSLYRVLGEAAMLIDAVAQFWDMVTGPRRGVRNPLLRSILDLLDRIAGLFAQVIGFVAFLLTRIAPLIPYLVNQFRALQSLGIAVVEALADIFTDFGDRVAAPFTAQPGLLAVLQHVFESFLALPGLLVQKVSELVEDATIELLAAFGAISSAIDTFTDELFSQIAAAFGSTPVGILVERIQRLLELMPAIGEAFTTSGGGADQEAAEESQMGFFGRSALWIVTGGLTGSLENLFESFENIDVPDFPELAVPEFPATPSLPDLDEIMQRIGEPSGLDMTTLSERLRSEAEAALAERDIPEGILRRPASAFALERRELERTMGRPELQLDDERLRDLIYIAVGRVLPPALRVYAPDVREMFDALDEQVYGVERTPLEHPMLDIEDSGRLRPVVDLLTIRSDGGFAPDLRAFRDLLIDELEGRAYLVPTAE
jgi:hypothetical protein